MYNKDYNKIWNANNAYSSSKKSKTTIKVVFIITKEAGVILIGKKMIFYALILLVVIKIKELKVVKEDFMTLKKEFIVKKIKIKIILLLICDNLYLNNS